MNGTLLSVDKATGTTTTIGSTGVTPQYVTGGVIDKKSGTFFWSVCTDTESALYTVDTTTGAATKFYEFPNREEFACLFIVNPPAEDGAPAVPTDLTASFEDDALAGTVSFKAPTTLYDGTAAEGALTYNVLANNVEVATGSTEFGGTVSANVTLETAGTYEFVVTVSNSVGASPKARTTLFVGADYPEAPSNATLTYADGKMSVAWDSVKTSLNDGYINVDEITYTVTRYPDSTVVASNLAVTTFEEAYTEPDGILNVYYTVEATSRGMKSSAASTNSVIVGAIVPPYTETFDDKSSFDLFTVIDANDDGSTWSYDSSNGCASFEYDLFNDGDDWLITAPLKLQGGYVYELSFTAHSSIYYTEKLEVKLGTECSVAGMTNTLLETVTIESDDDITFTAFIKPETDGKYYIGFHATSEVDNYYIFLDNLKVSAAMSTTAPDVVSNLVATPNTNGEYKATVSFKAPATDISGNTLSTLSKIDITSDNKVLATIESPTPGNEYSADLTFDTCGTYEISVVASNESGEGRTASVSCYVGTFAPTAPKDVTLVETDTPGEVTLSWTAPTVTTEGTALDPSLVVYAIVNSDSETIVSGLTTTSYTFQAVPTGSQEFVQYAVYAVTEGGQAAAASNLISAGTSYTIPFTESFTDSSLSHIFATGQAVNNGAWNIYKDTSVSGITSADGDNGFAAMYGTSAGASASLWSGKIAVEGVEKPALVYNVYNLLGSGVANSNTIEVLISTDNGSNWTSLRSVTLSELNEPEGWSTQIIDLTEYLNKTINLKFTATVNTYRLISIDNIRIKNLEDYSLVASAIDAPESVEANEEFNVTVAVINDGANTAEGFSVTLYRNGEAVDTKEWLSLVPRTTGTLIFSQTLNPAYAGNNEYYAVVTYGSDYSTADNTTSAVTTTVTTSSLPTPTDLKAVYNETSNAVTLSWNAPDVESLAPSGTLEDFESATSWSRTYGDWTFVDADGGPTGGFSSITIPNITKEEPAGFFVFDAGDATVTGSFAESLKANSGTKYLASLFNQDGTQTDNWAISPELSGTAQTVTFYAKSYSANYPEKIQVDYSTTDTATASFTQTILTVSAVPSSWTKYSFDLPEGAKYFAIRSIATDAFMLMIDDVTFVSADTEIVETKISGYNIYRDKVKVNSEVVGTTAESLSYVDYEYGSMDAKYIVTAVIENRGETGGSNEATIEVSGVSDVLKSTAVKAYANDGNIIVENAEGKQVNIYSVDGKNIYSEEGEQKTVIPAEQGVYVVKTGSTTAKVIVK